MRTATANANVDNLFLREPREAAQALAKAGNVVALTTGQVLYEAGSKISHLYFPSLGTLISMLSVTDEGDLAEVGVISSDGVVGFNALMGSRTSTQRVVVQIEGRALRIPVAAVQKVLQQQPQLMTQLLQFINLMFAQVSQTALCNRLHTVEERLSRWLLVSMDRVASKQLPLTHETLAHMLGTRRATVSLTAAVLQEAGVIRYTRGKIEVRDRERLEEIACDCYATVRKQVAEIYPAAAEQLF